MAPSNEAQKLLILELANTLLKSWWTVVVGACVGLSVALVVLQHTPELFEARATIAADVERLPREFIRPTVSEDLEVQLRALRDAVLSAANLEAVVAETFGAPVSEEQETRLMNLIASRSRLNFNRGSRILSIFYSDDDAYRSADVANMLAELFVLENQELRAESARMVRESLEKLTGDVEAELQEKRAELGELLAKHVHEVESERYSNEQRLENLRQDLQNSQREVSAARNRLQVLEAQRTHGQPQAPSEPRVPTGIPVTDPRIRELEDEIAEMLHRLTENHPDVAAKRRELERLTADHSRETEDASEGGTPPPPSVLPSLDIWETRVRAAKLEVGRLEEEGRQIRRETSKYEQYLANTPTIQRQVDDLEARVQVLQAQSRENQKKIETAKSGEQLEGEELANPFMITGFADPPAFPVYPDRLRFLGTGAGVGLLLLVGPLLAQGFVRPRIMFEASLPGLANVPVLATIPEVPTAASTRRARRIQWRNFGLSFLAVSVLGAVYALQYMNLI